VEISLPPGVRPSVTFDTPSSLAAVQATSGKRQGEKKSEQVNVETTRIVLTGVMQRAVEQLGREVSGDLLRGMQHQRIRC